MASALSRSVHLSGVPSDGAHEAGPTCLQVQVSVGPDGPGGVLTQSHEHGLRQRLVPVPLALDGHFATSKSPVRLLLNLPEERSCRERRQSRGHAALGLNLGPHLPASGDPSQCGQSDLLCEMETIHHTAWALVTVNGAAFLLSGEGRPP